MEFVAGSVGFEFFDPEFTAVCWCGAVFAAAVAMPEAAVDEDNGFVFGEDNVGLTGQLGDVEAKAVAHPMEHGTNEEFWLGILPFDSGHIPRPSFFCEAFFVQARG